MASVSCRENWGENVLLKPQRLFGRKSEGEKGEGEVGKKGRRGESSDVGNVSRIRLMSVACLLHNSLLGNIRSC